jgi:hypothetical protein
VIILGLCLTQARSPARPTTQTCSYECPSGGLTIAVLVAGLTRFGNDIRGYAWLGIWIGGVALMVLALVAASGWLAGNGPVDPTQPSSTWGSPGPVVGWGEPPVCAAWLALGAVMTWILNAPGSKARESIGGFARAGARPR